MKKIFVVDWALLVVFLPTALTGLMVHAAGHRAAHATWHNLSVLHIVLSVLCLILVVRHVWMHRGWYRSLLKAGLGKKSPVTVMLSMLFAVLTATGLFLLAVEGSGSSLGMWHYRLGIFTIVIVFGHFLKRKHLLLKGRGKCISHKKNFLFCVLAVLSVLSDYV